MKYIEGQNRQQITLLPEAMDDYIGEDNPVRVIDAFVGNMDLDELGIKVSKAETGRPAYNPKDMLKIYLYGYFNKVRSSRCLETETKRNVEVMWLMKRLSPDHKTISRFRKDNAKALKNIFRYFVELCRKHDLYGKEIIAIDGSKFKAVNALENNYGHKKIKDRVKRIDDKLEIYLQQLNENDEKESALKAHTKEELEQIITDLKERKHKYEAIQEHLDNTGETQISTTDTDAKRMNHSNGRSEICYNVQSAVDDKNKLIVEYEVTNRCNDKNLLAPMAKSVKEILKAEEITVIADEGYFVATDIAECITNGITPHVSNKLDEITLCIPVSKKESNTPQHFEGKGKSVYIKERNLGICPMGNILYPSSYVPSLRAARYSNRAACKNCSRKNICTKYSKALEIKIPKSNFSTEYDDEGLYFKQITYTADKGMLKRRKAIVEHPFGTIKRHMNSDYCLLKGKDNVQGEFALTFLVYNLKRTINILGAKKALELVSA